MSRKSVLVSLSAILFAVWAMPLAAAEVPTLDTTRYHSWTEVEDYLDAIANNRDLSEIVKSIPIGHTREGKCLKVLQISKHGNRDKHPDKKPATFIMGAHHAREHVSKEAVLALIDRIINGYGGTDPEGQAITYLVDSGTFYLLPWVNPDGGMNAFLHNPYQRKTNSPVDEPQIGAAACDTCGDGLVDEDSPDIATGDVGETSRSGFVINFPNNGIISRRLQAWYEADNYTYPVLDERAQRVQPGFSIYTYNYEGFDPDGDGAYSAYSGEDSVGGVDANRNFGEPRWGDCAGDDGCSWLSGSLFYAGPEPFSEPETAAVAAFLRSHPNIVSVESLHSGVTKIYPPDWIYPDDAALNTMDQRYQDSVAQYIAAETGYEVDYIQPIDSKGSTISYSYFGASQDPGLGLEFFPGGVLSFVTEIYGTGNPAGSAEAIQDWFPHHYQQFDTNYPQGLFLAWSDYPYCTTCDPDQMPGPLDIWSYLQYLEYFVFNSVDNCDGVTDPDVFHCDYWGVSGNTSYYADKDMFASHNPPASNRCYSGWNCTGAELQRTVDRQIKHLLYRLYMAPFIKVNAEEITFDGTTLSVAIENTGILRSSIQTTSRFGEDPFTSRYNDYGQVEVRLWRPHGFTPMGPRHVNIGWLGGGHPEDPEPRVKTAQYTVKRLSPGDTFYVTASSEKTGSVTALVGVFPSGGGPTDYEFEVLWTNYADRSAMVNAYFMGEHAGLLETMYRTGHEITLDMADSSRKRRIPEVTGTSFDVIPGHVRGITLPDDH